MLPQQCLLVAKYNRKGKEQPLLPGLSLTELSQCHLEQHRADTGPAFELAGHKPAFLTATTAAEGTQMGRERSCHLPGSRT